MENRGLADFKTTWKNEKQSEVFCERCGRELEVNNHEKGKVVFDISAGKPVRVLGIAKVPVDSVDGKMRCNRFKCRILLSLMNYLPYSEYWMVDGEIYSIFTEGI